jgi:hypothetical protein
MVGTVITVLVVVSAIATILGWLGFAPNGPHIVAGIKARIHEPEQLRRQVVELRKKNDDQAEQIFELTRNNGMLLGAVTQRERDLLRETC